jgi:hypothetical protein
VATVFWTPAFAAADFDATPLAAAPPFFETTLDFTSAFGAAPLCRETLFTAGFRAAGLRAFAVFAVVFLAGIWLPSR